MYFHVYLIYRFTRTFTDHSSVITRCWGFELQNGKSSLKSPQTLATQDFAPASFLSTPDIKPHQSGYFKRNAQSIRGCGFFIFLKFAFWKKDIFEVYGATEGHCPPDCSIKYRLTLPCALFQAPRPPNGGKNIYKKQRVGLLVSQPSDRRFFVAQEVQKGRTLLCPLC